jgi:hypothetical protein
MAPGHYTGLLLDFGGVLSSDFLGSIDDFCRGDAWCRALAFQDDRVQQLGSC